ncbi:uncharacterized protein LOC129741578 [Uranotaenia lowii]|uniref:uncharacterized protein LOC129741578 n=1 Tax=Uranotaenia lowii TaxID=190385 RepID=UPI0024784F67|nr:uncharacterized protein LOC129741578 [Uranotaenia lowii]
MFRYEQLVFVLFIHFSKILIVLNTTQLQRIEFSSEGEKFFETDIRVKKFNRTVAVLDGTLNLTKDIDNSYKGMLKFSYSVLGNNQFNDYPLKWPQAPVCDFLKNSYRDYQWMVKNCSNFPEVPQDGELCPFPKGDYWIKNFHRVDMEMWNFIPDGLWRITFKLSGPGKVQGKIDAFVVLRKGDPWSRPSQNKNETSS